MLPTGAWLQDPPDPYVGLLGCLSNGTAVLASRQVAQAEEELIHLACLLETRHSLVM